MPVSLVEALKDGRIKPGGIVLMPGFGAGLTFGALVLRWGERVIPLGESSRTLPPFDGTALELVQSIRDTQDPHGRSAAGLMSPPLADVAV